MDADEGAEGAEGGIDILDTAPQQGGGAVTERTTTPYMTKYERARILQVIVRIKTSRLRSAPADAAHQPLCRDAS